MINASITKNLSSESFRITAYIDPFNKRLRVDDYLGSLTKGIHKAESVAKEYKVEKLIFKVRLEHINEFLSQGYCCEAKIDGYFLGSDCYFFSKYYHPDRRKNDKWVDEDETIRKVSSLPRKIEVLTPPKELLLKKITLADTVALAALYKKIFPIYPTPLHESDYIKKTIDEGTLYFGFEQNGVIVSAASAEVNVNYKNAEITDCATLVSHRKHGLMKFLIQKLEQSLSDSGIYCAYSLARAQSFGMNAVFQQLNYLYRGRMLNNCFIYENLEDMNVWVKDLSRNTGN